MKAKNIYYFAYGSNMSKPRFQSRIANSKYIGVAKLEEHKLTFHKCGADNSGKCDASFTGKKKDYVLGVVFSMPRFFKSKLDAIEGVGFGYEVMPEIVVTESGKEIECFLYVATETDKRCVPYHWYKNHVVVGAREAKLPQAYINKIVKVRAKKDHSEWRHDQEMEIYRPKSYKKNKTVYRRVVKNVNFKINPSNTSNWNFRNSEGSVFNFINGVRVKTEFKKEKTRYTSIMEY